MATRMPAVTLRRISTAIAAIAVVTLPACIPREPAPYRPLAIGLTGGQPEILFRGCPAAPIVGVRIYDSGDDNTFDDRSDLLLWEITFESPTSDREISVAAVPRGARVIRPWPGGVSPERPLVAQVETTDDEVYEDFQLNDLRVGEYLVEGELLDRRTVDLRPCVDPRSSD